MVVAYLMFSLIYMAFAQFTPKIQLIHGREGIEDFDHQFKGCPENSECDQVMAMQLTNWHQKIKDLKEQKADDSKKMETLEIFRQKYGIPIEFYTTQKSQQGFKPVLFNSPCKNHNPKEGEKILTGISFVKSISSKSAIIWRDQTQIEVPLGEFFFPQPVIVYYPNGPKLYQLPLKDQPLFIKDKELHIIKEDHDFFYSLKISHDAKWKVADFPKENLSLLESKRSNIECPKDQFSIRRDIFSREFCKSIWSEDLKKNITIKMHMGCD